MQPRKKRQRGRDGAGEQVGGEIELVEVNAGRELGRDWAREGIGGEVEDDEVREPGAKRGRDGAGEVVIREVEGGDGGAVTESGGDGAREGGGRERQRHDTVFITVPTEDAEEAAEEVVGRDVRKGPRPEFSFRVGDGGLEAMEAGDVVRHGRFQPC